MYNKKKLIFESIKFITFIKHLVMYINIRIGFKDSKIQRFKAVEEASIIR